MLKKILIFSIGFLCAWILFSAGMKKGSCQVNLPSNISFAADSSSFFFFDRDEAKVYAYNAQGKIIHTYAVKELGKNLISQ